MIAALCAGLALGTHTAEAGSLTWETGPDLTPYLLRPCETGLQPPEAFDDPVVYNLHAGLWDAHCREVAGPPAPLLAVRLGITETELLRRTFNGYQIPRPPYYVPDPPYRPTTPIPLPGAGFLLLAALGAFLLIRRRSARG